MLKSELHATIPQWKEKEKKILVRFLKSSLGFCWFAQFAAHFCFVSRWKLCFEQSRPPSPRVTTKYKSIGRSRVHTLAVISMLIIVSIQLLSIFKQLQIFQEPAAQSTSPANQSLQFVFQHRRRCHKEDDNPVASIFSFVCAASN